MAKKPTTLKADEVETTDVVDTAEVETTVEVVDATTENQEEADETQAKSDTVKVKNLTKSRFVQPSSGVTLWPQEVKPLNNDGWLDNQITAGLLEIV